MLLFLFSLYSIAFTMLMITCYKEPQKKHHTLAKFINSLMFIVVATCGVITSGNISLYFDMLPALIMCLIGDVILALLKGMKNKKLFLFGLAFF